MVTGFGVREDSTGYRFVTFGPSLKPESQKAVSAMVKAGYSEKVAIRYLGYFGNLVHLARQAGGVGHSLTSNQMSGSYYLMLCRFAPPGAVTQSGSIHDLCCKVYLNRPGECTLMHGWIVDGDGNPTGQAYCLIA